MDVSHIHTVIDIDALADWIGLQSQASRDALRQKCSIWRKDASDLHALSYQFVSVREAITSHPDVQKRIDGLFADFEKLETEVRTILEPSSELEHESSAELIFLNTILSPLNFVPFILTIWSYVRVYILPGMSILIPILMGILPYFILRFMFHLHIPMNRYFAMMAGLLTGDVSGMMNPESCPTIGDLCSAFMHTLQTSPIQAIMKLGGVGATIVQSLVQPYFSYRHLSKINTILYTQGNTLTQLSDIYNTIEKELESIGMEMPRSPLPTVTCERQHMAHVLLDPVPYKIAIRSIGQIEALWRLASHPDITHVLWISQETPVFSLENTFDIHVDPQSRKPLTINLGNKKHHALLTGPNRGGKSTALRAMTLSALLAHTYGCSIGSAATMTPFHYMYAGLKADDIPGTKSHFEREVDFTARTLCADGPTLVFVDELFHTTNPPDALASCRLYCDQLWAKSSIISVISTHLFELVESANNDLVQRICCPATVNPDTGIVNYEYGLSNGICKVSSVYEILEKYGYTIPTESALNLVSKKSKDGQK
jgi:hypothetical protein